MRRLIAATALAALAACGETTQVDQDATPDESEAATATTEPTPEPSSTQSEEAAPAPKPVAKLTTTGVQAGSTAFRYAADRNEVEAALKSVLGEPTKRTGMDECGAGPMKFTDYAGGVTFNFQDGKLVGWNWRSLQDGDAAAKGEIALEGPAKIGTARTAVEAASGFQMFEDSTLGDEFQLNDNLFGFFEEGKVSMLFSGTQCFFR